MTGTELQRSSPVGGAIALLSVPVALALAGLVVSGDGYLLQLASTAALTAAVALGLTILVGWTGLVSFAQAALYGVGAYTAAILTVHYEWPFLVGFFAAIVASALIGLLVALPSVRLGGAYFAIGTIGLQLILTTIVTKGGDLTGGPGGLYGIEFPTVAGLEIGPGLPTYFLTAGWLAIVTIFAMRLRVSKFGWELRMIGNDEEAASSLGIPIARRKLVASVVASAIAGGTGSLYAHTTGVVDPGTFSLQLSAILIVMVLLGGRGSVPAVLVSAVLLSFLPEYLRWLSDYRLLVFGAVMVAIILFLPEGVASLRDVIRARIQGALRRRAVGPYLREEVESE